jgi:hypothetical protein
MRFPQCPQTISVKPRPSRIQARGAHIWPVRLAERRNGHTPAAYVRQSADGWVVVTGAAEAS